MRNISDDVTIWGKTQHENDFCLPKALWRVQEHGLTLNKCPFYLPKITFFRMDLSKDDISDNETKLTPLKSLKRWKI